MYSSVIEVVVVDVAIGLPGDRRGHLELRGQGRLEILQEIVWGVQHGGGTVMNRLSEANLKHSYTK